MKTGDGEAIAGCRANAVPQVSTRRYTRNTHKQDGDAAQVAAEPLRVVTLSARIHEFVIGARLAEAQVRGVNGRGPEGSSTQRQAGIETRRTAFDRLRAAVVAQAAIVAGGRLDRVLLVAAAASHAETGCAYVTPLQTVSHLGV